MSDPVEDAVLTALALLEDGDAPGALACLVEQSARHPGHSDLADAWASLGDSAPARGPFGETVLLALLPVARAWPDPRGRSTLMMALAELEVTHREVSWAAHWLKAAMTADPSDPRPWDLLELMLDAHPHLPVGADTKKVLRQIRQAKGELPVKEDDFSGVTVDSWSTEQS
jgi:hypothetical protein